MDGVPCVWCEGEGEIEMDRCPASQSAGLDEFFEAWVSQITDGDWPAPGGRLDQSAWYVRAKAIADAERAKILDRPRAAKEAIGA